MGLFVEVLGSGPTVVLLHPVGLDGRSWRHVAADLSEDHTVLCVDLPGHGRSPMAGTGACLSEYAAAAESAIAARADGPYVLVGLSFGGMIAQTIAIASTEKLRAAIVCGCGSTFDDAMRPLIAQRGKDAVNGGMAAVVEPTIERWFSPSFLGDPAVADIRAQLIDEDVESWAGAWQAISALDTAPALNRITVPTLCVAGGADMATSPQMVRTMADGIANSRFAEIEGAPHMMQIERPKEMVAVIRSFLEGLDRVEPR